MDISLLVARGWERVEKGINWQSTKEFWDSETILYDTKIVDI